MTQSWDGAERRKRNGFLIDRAGYNPLHDRETAVVREGDPIKPSNPIYAGGNDGYLCQDGDCEKPSQGRLMGLWLCKEHYNQLVEKTSE